MKLTESIELHKSESEKAQSLYAAAEAAIRAIRPLTNDVFELLDEKDEEATAIRKALNHLADARCAAATSRQQAHISRIQP